MQDFMWVRVLLGILVHAALFLVALWDLAAMAVNQPGLTVSALLQEWGMTNPILPLAAGVIIGHLFWPIR